MKVHKDARSCGRIEDMDVSYELSFGIYTKKGTGRSACATKRKASPEATRNAMQKDYTGVAMGSSSGNCPKFARDRFARFGHANPLKREQPASLGIES